ncbi:hypothetical protein HZU83_10965 [Sphaerotilus montanus]|uniref:Uncharacterized protein n=1 Tax=Sphaerotilus montanus TaxID=522889 RepID=A0A7Y9UM43_9BURK|nr:hypothetical protein [Sphaerotilus montanus]NYG35460.1 hypothetical protein [Sphaerotilus montanus]NZD57207.1 hypothetical protein [Sphaerotilus montanus]
MSARTSSRTALRRLLPLSVATATLLLAGCSGPAALRSGYVDYSHAQAQVGNQQTLLNLARIRNGHPPYFLQMGAITASYSFTRGTNGSASHTLGTMPGALPEMFTRALGLSGSATEAPMFNFAPLSGPGFSAVIMKPIDPRTFSGLAMQGFSATALMRMLADEVTLTNASGQKTVLRNGFDAQDSDNYGDFLRLVEALQTLQYARALVTGTDAGGTTLRITADDRAGAVLQRLATRDGAKAQFKTLGNQALAGGFSVDVKLRTFVGTLYAMAYDGAGADALPAALRESLPEGQRDAVLRIEAASDLTEPEAASVDYAGRKYVISDKAGSLRYRTTFQGLQFVFAQTELNPGQLPQASVIQMR